jgi:hypothetical protein
LASARGEKDHSRTDVHRRAEGTFVSKKRHHIVAFETNIRPGREGTFVSGKKHHIAAFETNIRPGREGTFVSGKKHHIAAFETNIHPGREGTFVSGKKHHIAAFEPNIRPGREGTSVSGKKKTTSKPGKQASAGRRGPRSRRATGAPRRPTTKLPPGNLAGQAARCRHLDAAASAPGPPAGRLAPQARRRQPLSGGTSPRTCHNKSTSRRLGVGENPHGASTRPTAFPVLPCVLLPMPPDLECVTMGTGCGVARAPYCSSSALRTIPVWAPFRSCWCCSDAGGSSGPEAARRRSPAPKGLPRLSGGSERWD